MVLLPGAVWAAAGSDLRATLPGARATPAGEAGGFDLGAWVVAGVRSAWAPPECSGRGFGVSGAAAWAGAPRVGRALAGADETAAVGVAAPACWVAAEGWTAAVGAPFGATVLGVGGSGSVVSDWAGAAVCESAAAASTRRATLSRTPAALAVGRGAAGVGAGVVSLLVRAAGGAASTRGLRQRRRGGGRRLWRGGSLRLDRRGRAHACGSVVRGGLFLDGGLLLWLAKRAADSSGAELPSAERAVGADETAAVGVAAPACWVAAEGWTAAVGAPFGATVLGVGGSGSVVSDWAGAAVCQSAAAASTRRATLSRTPAALAVGRGAAGVGAGVVSLLVRAAGGAASTGV